MDPVLVRSEYLGGLLDWKIGRLVGGERFRRLLVRIYESNVLWTAAGKYPLRVLGTIGPVSQWADSAQGFVSRIRLRSAGRLRGQSELSTGPKRLESR